MKVGILGYGVIGWCHSNYLEKNKIFEIAGVYDVSEERNVVARKNGIHVYSSYDEMLNDEQVDIVIIGVPNYLHEEMAIKALEAGKHVFCEKPVTLNCKQLDNIYKVAEQKNRKFIVDQNRRFDKDFMIIDKIIKENYIGKINRIESNVMGSYGIPGTWRKYKECGGGMIYDWGVHLIDQLIHAFQKKVKQVYCKSYNYYNYEVEDGFFLQMIFEDGMECNIKVDTNSYIEAPRWVVYGEEGTAIIENWDCKGKIIKVIQKDDENRLAIALGNGFSKTMASRSEQTISTIKLPEVKETPDEIYINLKEMIENGKECIIKYDELNRVLKIIDKAFESMETRKVIETEI